MNNERTKNIKKGYTMLDATISIVFLTFLIIVATKFNSIYDDIMMNTQSALNKSTEQQAKLAHFYNYAIQEKALNIGEYAEYKIKVDSIEETSNYYFYKIIIDDNSYNILIPKGE